MLIPEVKSVAVLLVSTVPFIFMLFALNVVPVGISSFTTATPNSVPVFSMFTLYVISSPCFTLLPDAGVDDFDADITAILSI